jgi:hypothetical protein
MNKTALEMEKLKQEKELKEKEMGVDRESSRRAAGAKILSSVIKAAKFQDVSWYKKVFEKLESFGSIPNYHRTGFDVYTESKLGTYCHGGVAVINWLPSIGSQNQIKTIPLNAMNNPIYFSINNLQQQLRKRNSRIGEYDPSDIALYLLGSVDIIEDVERAKFLLNLLFTQSNENKYYGMGVMQALGYSYAGECLRRAENIQNLQTLIRDVNENIPVPYTLAYLQRRKWLAQFICRDAESPRSQIYVFKKEYNYQWDDTGNLLDYRKQSTSIFDLLDSIRRRLNLIKDSSHFQHLLQDLRGAMTPDKWYKILPFEDVDMVIPYIQEPLMQIENIVTIPSWFDNTEDIVKSGKVQVTRSGYFYQGADENHVGIWFDGLPQTTTITDDLINRFNKTPLITKTNILNFHDKLDPKADDIVIATRLQSYGEVFKQNDMIVFTPLTCGTEIVRCITLFGFTTNGSVLTKDLHTDEVFDTPISTGVFPSGEYPDLVDKLMRASEFRYMPLINASTINDTTPEIVFYGKEPTAFRTFGETNVYFPIAKGNIEILHRNCIISLFYLTDSDFLPPLN